MIPEITLENVQSHKKSTIYFHPGINVLQGPSDCGKSAVIRGLQWWALNQANWGELQRHETSFTSVEGKGVKKYRSAALHHYEAGDVKYKALRSDVPSGIQKVIGLDEMNFQSQHAPYFLISDSAGEVAKKLNAVGDLQIIDLSLKAARAKVKETNTQGKFLNEELAKTTTKIADLQWVVEANKDYQEIEALELESKTIEITGLSVMIGKILRLQEEFDRTPPTAVDLRRISTAVDELDIDLSLGDLIKKVENNQVVIPEMGEDITSVRQLEVSLETLQASIVELRPRLIEAVTCKSEVNLYPDEIDDLLPEVTELLSVEKSLSEIETAFMEAFTAEDCLEAATAAHNEGKINYHDKLKEVGYCPLCGGELENCISE